MPHSVFTSGAVALITGGASGIGLAVAQRCAEAGMRVAIVDVNGTALEEAKSKMLAGAEVATYNVDVSQQDAWRQLHTDVEKQFGNVQCLMLNAGMGLRGSWKEADYFHKVMDTNLFGVIHGISTFLPSVQAAAEAGKPTAIIITGSKQGITNPPGNAAYNASKAAVKTLAEHLSYDLRSTSTTVHLLVPGWTFTGLTRAAGKTEKPDGAWAPEQVAGFLAKKMDEGQFYVICPDNDVTEDTDRKRMLWGVGDIVYGRPPLSRWREDWKEKAQKGIEETKF